MTPDGVSRVVIVGPSPRFASGISTYTIRLANAFAKLGVATHVVAYRNLLPRFMFPGRNRVGKQITSLKFETEVSVFDQVDYNRPSSWRTAARFIREARPEVVIFQWWSASVAHLHLVLTRAAKRAGARVVYEMHETLDPFEDSFFAIRWYSRLMTGHIMPRVDRFVVHSEADRSHVRSQYLIPDAKISVVPHPVYDHFGGADRTGARREFGISDSDYALLAFGLIRSYKGIPDLIREFGELPDELSGKTKLVIVGEVWEGRDRIETALRQCRCRQRISFIDRYVPDSEVPKYFAAGDALVLPYTRASQSGVAHIAKAYGMPILATKVGGLAEALRDYPCGRLIEPGTPGILRAALISLVQERPPRGSVETVAESWEDVARGYRNVISIAA